MPRPGLVLLVAAVVLGAGPTAGATSFVNWETPHVHPLDLTPDGTTLLAVNTADNRLEIFDVRNGTPVHVASVPVGLDPVSVRARSDTEAWVVNHVSDSVSIVDLVTRRVVRTLGTADEPSDVVFAGTPARAFVSCSQVNQILVYDPTSPLAAPVVVTLEAEDPRALAVSPDRTKVYAAIFESGNGSTILGGGASNPAFFPPNAVSDPLGPYGGVNPPPNAGSGFDPPLNPLNPPPPPVGLIVKRDALGHWMDDNGGDWSLLVSGAEAARSGRPVGWELVDHDLAVLDAATLSVEYVRGLMNLCMAASVDPATGRIAVTGTDGTNEVRFEPKLNGRFLRVDLALVDPARLATPSIVDLNPHLSYTAPAVPQALRDRSIGDPRAATWNASGTRLYVAGMGSDNVVALDAAGARVGSGVPIEVGRGPTGLALDELRARLYALNKFEASVSAIDTVLGAEIARVPFHDPTPAPVAAGRRHLYDTHETSGLGHASCASCHPDARMDRLAWDLGNPAGDVRSFNQNCNAGQLVLGSGPCPDWSPMKGPMVTQTLQDIIGKEPHHWRGDRNGIEEFNQTFMNLQGDDELLGAAEMQELEQFLASIFFPPNPHRTFTNIFPATLPLVGHYFAGVGGPTGDPMPPGSPGKGRADFLNHHLVTGFAVSCSTCHTLPTGVATNKTFTVSPPVQLPPGPDGELHHAVVRSNVSETPQHSIKVPQLRNLHEKVGFEMTQLRSRAGFGFLHDGSVDSLARFISNPPFNFGNPIDGPVVAKVTGMVAFMLAFAGSDHPTPTGANANAGPLSQDTHAAVGQQLTFDGTNNTDPAAVDLLGAMMGVADAVPDIMPGPLAALVAKGRQNGLQRGWTYVGGGTFQADRGSETIGSAALRTSAGAGAEITFTVVPRGSELRIGIDRDEDGAFDRDELDACSEATDDADTPDDDVGSPRLAVDRSGLDLVLSWEAIGTSYDVVTGDLDVLYGGGGFAAAIERCLADDATETTLVLPGAVSDSSSLFFLVRAACIGGASYDSDSPAQAGSRDRAIDASPAACPA